MPADNLTEVLAFDAHHAAFRKIGDFLANMTDDFKRRSTSSKKYFRTDYFKTMMSANLTRTTSIRCLRVPQGPPASQSNEHNWTRQLWYGPAPLISDGQLGLDHPSLSYLALPSAVGQGRFVVFQILNNYSHKSSANT